MFSTVYVNILVLKESALFPLNFSLHCKDIWLCGTRLYLGLSGIIGSHVQLYKYVGKYFRSDLRYPTNKICASVKCWLGPSVINTMVNF